MKKTLAASGVAGLAGLALAVCFAAPASAADTITTVTVGSAGLSITAPTESDLGTGNPGTTVTDDLGPVTVTDDRALLTAGWTASVIASDFKTGAGTSAETIPNINVRYWSGAATASTGIGTGTLTPGQATAAAAAIINVPTTAFSLTGGSGDNSATWDPTMEIAVPVAAVGGVYTGTVTHSVF